MSARSGGADMKGQSVTVDALFVAFIAITAFCAAAGACDGWLLARDGDMGCGFRGFPGNTTITTRSPYSLHYPPRIVIYNMIMTCSVNS